MKILMENWRKFKQLNEEASPIQGFDAEEFPNPLPGAQSKSFMSKGWDDNPEDQTVDKKRDDDIVQVDIEGGVPVESAMPSQNAVFLGKALGMSMVPKLSSGGNIGAVISGDGHILDGHHRWAATMLRTGGGVNLAGTVVNLPIQQLIPVLRSVGDAYGNQRKGEPKTGDLNIFSEEAANPETIKTMVETGKYMDPQFYDREKLSAHVESLGGYEALAERVRKLQALAGAAYGGSGVANAPPRLQMPVLEPKKGHVSGAAKRLQKGTIDVAPPYGDLEDAAAAHGGEDLESRQAKMRQAVSEQIAKIIRSKLK